MFSWYMPVQLVPSLTDPIERREQGRTNAVAVHDPDYRTALNDFTTFLEVLSEKVSEADETIPELPVKDIVSIPFRRLAFVYHEFQNGD